MLRIEDYTCGTLNDAKPFAVVLPRREREERFLIGSMADKKIAIVLGGDEAFRSFVCDGNTQWGGLIIHSPRIEVDETTVFRPSWDQTPLGSIVREKDYLAVQANQPSSSWGFHGLAIPLITNLPMLPENEAVGFKRWQIVLGEGADKRKLLDSQNFNS